MYRSRFLVVFVLDSGSRDASLPSGVYCVESLEDIDGEYLERIYRRTKGIPWNIVETEHLLIREIIPEDVPRLYELYSDDSITKYMDNLYSDPEQELSYTRDYIQNIYGFYGYGMWIITLKDTGVVIGRGLAWNIRKAMTGWSLDLCWEQSINIMGMHTRHAVPFLSMAESGLDRMLSEQSYIRRICHQGIYVRDWDFNLVNHLQRWRKILQNIGLAENNMKKF